MRGFTPVAGAALAYAAHPDLDLPVATPAFAAALASGWSKPEAGGVWSDGGHAVLRLPRPAGPAERLTVTLDGLGYQPAGRPPQRAFVSVAGTRLATWSLDGAGYRPLRVSAPGAPGPPGAPLELVIDLPDALSPDAVLAGSGDPRRLGIGVRRITLAH